MAFQFFDVVPDAAHAELAEIREVLANLRGIQMKLLGECFRRHRFGAVGVERVEAAEIDRQAPRCQFGDLIAAGPPLVPSGHKLGILAVNSHYTRSMRHRALVTLSVFGAVCLAAMTV